MRRTITVIVLIWGVMLLLGCALQEGGGQPSEPIVWRSLPDGKAEALKRNMPVLVDFYYGPECHRCKMLDEQIYADPQTAARINRDFIPVRVDLSKELSPDEKELSKTLGTGGECMLAFLDPKGKVIADASGERICTMAMLTRQQFMAYLDRALAEIKR